MVSAARLFFKAVGVAQIGAMVAWPQLVRPLWPQFLELLGKTPEEQNKNANIWGLVLLHALILLVGNTFFYILYRGQFRFTEQFKIGTDPWPWQNFKKAEEWSQKMRWAVGWSFLNIALTVPLAFANYPFAAKMGFTAQLESYPSTLTVAWQLVAFMLIEDTMFYWGHRTFHEVKPLYRHVHKLHHWFVESVSIAAEFAHPVEYIVCNVTPFVAGPILLGAHAVALYAWLIFRIGETITNHSGYDLPWSPWSVIPLGGSATSHDFHHSNKRTADGKDGNYESFFCFWDKLMGTELPGTEERQEEIASGHGGVKAKSS